MRLQQIKQVNSDAQNSSWLRFSSNNKISLVLAEAALAVANLKEERIGQCVDINTPSRSTGSFSFLSH